MLLLLACAPPNDLMGTRPLDCEVETASAASDEIVDLGFSADQLRALIGERPHFTLAYDEDRPGVEDDVAFEGNGPVDAARVTRSGTQCADYGDAEVLTATWSVTFATGSGDVTGSGAVSVEAPTLDLATIRFSVGVGPNSEAADFGDGLWSEYFATFPDDAADACSSSVGWAGLVTDGEWSLSVDCDEDGDGVPEHSGKWAKASMTLLGEGASRR